jgi:phosphoglycerate kinase
LRLDRVAQALSALTERPLRKLDDAAGPDVVRAITELNDGDVVLLENLRFYPGEDVNDPHFAAELAELCDICCNDAFSLAHRALASTVAITRRVRPAAAGIALARELAMFEAVLDKPEPPFAGIIAGARIEEKLPVLENLSDTLDVLFIGGALAFTFLKARQYEVGAAPVDEAFTPLVRDFLAKAKSERTEVLLPVDFVVVDADAFRAFQASDRPSSTLEARHVSDREIEPSDLPVDIGPATLELIQRVIDGAHTLLWNGPLGVWEVEPFADGTREVARILLDRPKRQLQRSIICGDSLSRALRNSDIPVAELRHMSRRSRDRAP